MIVYLLKRALCIAALWVLFGYIITPAIDQTKQKSDCVELSSPHTLQVVKACS